MISKNCPDRKEILTKKLIFHGFILDKHRKTSEILKGNMVKTRNYQIKENVLQ